MTCCFKEAMVYSIWQSGAKGSRVQNEITVNLGSNRESVKIYDVTVGKDPVRTLQNVTSIHLTMTDHAMIVEIR